MLHPWVRRSYDDRRQSALYFAVSNDDVASTRVLLEAGAMPNQDPVKCLQVALRMGNYELINLLLRYGANVNYYCRVNTTHFPSALQYALKDEVVLRMLCNYGYHLERCFDCPFGEGSHVPHAYEGWSDTVIKDTPVSSVLMFGVRCFWRVSWTLFSSRHSSVRSSLSRGSSISREAWSASCWITSIMWPFAPNWRLCSLSRNSGLKSAKFKVCSKIFIWPSNSSTLYSNYILNICWFDPLYLFSNC